MTTPLFTADATVEQLSAAIRRFGYAIVQSLAPDLARAARDELAPHLDAAPLGVGEFTGTRTQRVSQLIARSAACRALATHERIVAVVEDRLRGSCYHPQLSHTQAICIHPGESAQSLHRDDNVFPLAHPRPPLVINSMWAISPFTVANGATRLVPKSHIYDDDQSPCELDALPATMSPGSVLLWDGALYHGGGANISDEARLGVVLTYSVGWLRQYENMYLSVPPHMAREFSDELQSLLGYRNHGFLGTYDNNDPREWLARPDGQPLPPRDLYTPRLDSLRQRRF